MGDWLAPSTYVAYKYPVSNHCPLQLILIFIYFKAVFTFKLQFFYNFMILDF